MKNKINKVILLSGLLLCSYTAAFAQRDTTCFRAMRDEMYRNFNKLKIPEFPRPFYISYLVVRGESINVDASFGAVTRAQTYPVMMPFVRTLVGNYHFNSEEAGGYQNSSAGQFPEESDYDAIRRYLWEATDASYKNSIRNYAGRQNKLRQQNIAVQGLPDDMSRIIPENTFVEYPLRSTSFDKERCAAYVQKVATLIDSYKQLDRTSVDLYGVQSEVMILTTEGTEVVVPYNFVMLNIKAVIYNFNNEMTNNTLALMVPSVDDLPSEAELYSRVDAFAKELAAASAAKAIEDNYFGPVLLEGEAVASFMDLQMTPRLMNAKAPVGQKNVDLPEHKLDKRIASADVSILAVPRTTQYNGVKLWGAFEVDIDGVKPADTLVLVKDGLLCELLSHRVCTKKVNTSNGHAHFALNRNGFAQVPAPGVLDLTVKNSFPQQRAKEALLEQARHEGLEYAYIIRSLLRVGDKLKVQSVSKVYVADGREEKGPPALVSFESTIARRIISASVEKSGYNRTTNGVLCSYITPLSMIVGEVDIAPFEASSSQPPVVADPRKK